MRIIVASARVPFHFGGAEVQAEGLVDALRRAGHIADIVAFPLVTESPRAALDAILSASMVSLATVGGLTVDRVIAFKFPAYFAQHPRMILWLIHPMREVYDLWRTTYHNIAMHGDGAAVRAAIAAADRRALTGAERIFAVSRNVCGRLQRFAGIRAEPLYPPPVNAASFTCAEAEDFLFFPGRLAAHKRHELAIRAVARVPGARLVVAGRAFDPAYPAHLIRLAEELGVADRVRVLAEISEAEKLDLYARCTAVLFPPFDEEYGLIAPEAMLAAKPIVTCSDSGGPLELVVDGRTGLVAEPTPEAIGLAIARLREAPAIAAAMGRDGRAHLDTLGVGWDRVVERLTS